MAPILEKEISVAAREKFEQRLRCKTDKFFLAQVMGFDFQEDVHTDLFNNYLQIDPTKTLQEQSKIKNRMVLWSRGTYKTYSIKVEIVQLILNFPDIRILLMQSTKGNAAVLLDSIRKHFDGTDPKSKISELFPEFCQLEKKLGTKYAFTTPARKSSKPEATVTVASPRSTKAGMHYDAGFFDDLVTEVNYKNPVALEKTKQEFSDVTPVFDEGAFRYVTGTRYAFGDLYEHIIRQDAENHTWQISLRACWTVNSDGTKKLLFPARVLPDGRVVGHTLEFLLQKQAEDPAMFAAQYLNRPVSTSAQLFTEEMLMSKVRSDKEKDFPQLGPTTLIIDLAASTRSEADHSVIIAGRNDANGVVYVTDVKGHNYSPSNLATAVLAMALKHKPIAIMIEGTASAKYFVEYLKVIAREKGIVLPLGFIDVNNNKDAKYLRIASLEGNFTNNSLYFMAGLPQWDRIVGEFSQVSLLHRGRHDDYPDTIALLVQYLSKTTPFRRPQVASIFDMIAAQATNSILPPNTHEQGLGSFF
jgi:hypothetical protein